MIPGSSWHVNLGVQLCGPNKQPAPQGASSQPVATAARQVWQNAICDNAAFTQVKAPSSATHSLSPLLSQVSVSKTHPSQPPLVFTLNVRIKIVVLKNN